MEEKDIRRSCAEGLGIVNDIRNSRMGRRVVVLFRLSYNACIHASDRQHRKQNWIGMGKV